MRSTCLRLKFHYLLILLFSASFVFGQQATAGARIIVPIDETRLVTLGGNTHPFARPQFDKGAAPDDLPTRRMMLLLSRAPEQQAALDKLLEEQQTPGSPHYRHWLTPAEFGQMFGPADADVQTITGWLQQQGFAIGGVTAGKSVIEFSGSAGQVRQAFHTAIHKYVVDGREYWANAQDPQIPAPFAPVAAGLVSLNNFTPKPLLHQIGLFLRDRSGIVTPGYTASNGSGTYYALGPADFAIIYSSNPLLQAGNNGAGQTIAVIGRSNVHLQDITDFRNLFGLGAGNTSVVIDGPDPGLVDGDESESLLDLEWANAVAPGVSVVLVSAQDTETTSGIDLAALHAIESNVAGVMSLSYSECEAHLGTAGNQYIQSLWQQAAAQGITVFVSSADSGSAGCDDPNVAQVATSGLAVNGLASTPYNVAVGGTDFDDAGTQSSYWSATNDSTTLASAKSYIPEMTWNETCAESATAGNLNVCSAPPAGWNIWAGSGGASSCTASISSGGSVTCQSGSPKPSWQTGPGVPSDGVRDIPDVSLFAAANSNSRSFYVLCQADEVPPGYTSCQPSNLGVYFFGVGGTSAAAPSFAGIIALAEQKAGTRLGNVNYLLYSLAAQSGASCTSAASPGPSCIFNDVVKGNISVPCQAGSPNCSQTSGTTTGVIVTSSQSPAYLAGSGYDLATGLGSVNAANLATAIATRVSGFTPTTSALTLNGSTVPLTAHHGDSINVGVTVSPSAVGSVALLGNSGGIDSNTLTAGMANWISKLFPGGNYTVKAHYAGDGVHGASDSNGVSVTVSPEASQSFVNLVTFDSKGAVQSFSGNNVNYGSPYLLRVDVTDAAGTVSPTQGVNSKCSTGNASCPTGTLTVSANGSALDGGSFPLNSKGFTEDQAIQLAAGTYMLAASYPGDASYSASTASSVVTVLQAPTTLTAGTPVLSPFEYGSSFQIGANVATTSLGTGPTGTVNFFDNGAPAGGSVHTILQTSQAGGASGYASLSYSGAYAAPTLGSHSLYAQYSGDVNYSGSNSSASPFSFTVAKATTWVNGYGIVPSTATPTLPVTLSATIFSTSQLDEPTGTITFYDNGTAINATVAYGGHAGSWNNPGTGNYIAVLSGNLTTMFSQVGNHAITATYSGDDKYTAVTQALGTLIIDAKLPTTLNLSVGLSPALVNYPTNLSLSVTCPTSAATGPTGSVTFYDAGQPLNGTVSYSSGSNSLTATLPYSFTTAGTHSLTASYSGDANYGSGSLTTPVPLTVVDMLATTIPYLNLYNSAVNQYTTLSVDVDSSAINTGPVMTGTVTFLDGGTPMAGNVSLTDVSGYIIAILPYTFTNPGTHNITVQYSGDAHYAATQSQVFPEDILGPLAVRLNANNLVIGASGGTGTANLAVYNTTSSPMTITLTCTPDSASATCSINTSTFNATANSQYALTVTFTVPALASAVRHSNPFAMPFVFAAVLAGLSLTTRRKGTLILALLMAALVTTVVSCGGGGGVVSGGPPSSKTYNFTITATSGTYTDTQVLTVTVQQ